MEEEEKKQGFKVNDRRRFDTEGKERDESAGGGDGVKREDRAAAEQPPRALSPDDEPQEQITFSAFVMSLATQVLLQLGAMKPPPGVNVPVDAEAAKHSIDILSLLETKTKGNLDKEEEYMLKEILHSVRMAFVQSSKK